MLDETTHSDEIAKDPAPTGWIDTPRGRRELRRIPCLSRLRNLSLKPIEELARQGLQFDKILFLNDVVFTVISTFPVIHSPTQEQHFVAMLIGQVEDVVTLLYTSEGSYSTTRALDFAKPPRYYDTFALRDSDGNEPIMQTWPYFSSSRSRSALKAGKPVRVESCWNGMCKSYQCSELVNRDPSLI